MTEYIFMTDKNFKIVIKHDYGDDWQYDIHDQDKDGSIIGGGSCGPSATSVEEALAFVQKFHDIGTITTT